MGSSAELKEEWEGHGIFKREKSENPEFHNWNAIYINYCSGTGPNFELIII